MRPFTIIPVLDLKQGLVVHARAGDRANYRPIRSSLNDGADPASVLAGLLTVAPFSAVYIADLDRIEGVGGHDALIGGLAARYPGLEFWVDGGFAAPRDAFMAAGAGMVPVLGSESWRDSEALVQTAACLGKDRCVLSLDYRDDRFMGPEDLPSMSDAWPDRVVAMTLSRVGSGAGPDLARFDEIAGQAGGKRVFAAGGVRGLSDLEALRERGAAGALIATALHDRRLSQKEIAGFAEV